MEFIINGEDFCNPVSSSGGYRQIIFGRDFSDQIIGDRWYEVLLIARKHGCALIDSCVYKDGYIIRSTSTQKLLEGFKAIMEFLKINNYSLKDEGIRHYRTGICNDPELPNKTYILKP